MKFDICEVFTQKDENEIEKFLLEKIKNVPKMELHKIVEEVLYEYEIDTMI